MFILKPKILCNGQILIRFKPICGLPKLLNSIKLETLALAKGVDKRGLKMSSDKKSRTEKDSFVEERIFGDSHYKTTISDGKHKVEGRGRTSEEAEKIASEKWDDEYGDEEDEDED